MAASRSNDDGTGFIAVFPLHRVTSRRCIDFRATISPVTSHVSSGSKPSRVNSTFFWLSHLHRQHRLGSGGSLVVSKLYRVTVHDESTLTALNSRRTKDFMGEGRASLTFSPSAINRASDTLTAERCRLEAVLRTGGTPVVDRSSAPLDSRINKCSFSCLFMFFSVHHVNTENITN